MVGMGMIDEPSHEPILEFLRSRTDSSAVVRLRNFPKDHTRIDGLDEARMAYRNVAVVLPVNEKDGHVGSGNGVSGGNGLHVEMVFPSDIKEGTLDHRAKEAAT